MTCLRQGCRRLHHLTLILALLGCTAETPSPNERRLPTAEIPRDSNRPTATASAVSRIVWAGPLAPGQCAVLRDDGRFTLHRREGSGIPVRNHSNAGEEPATSLAIVGEDRVVTGTASGLVLWETRSPECMIVSRLSCPAVSALLVVPDSSGDVTLLVGLQDGRLLRCQMGRDGRWHKPGNPATPGAPVQNLVAIPGTSDVMVIRQDGSAQRLRNDLVGHPIEDSPCRDLVFGPDAGMVARRVDDVTIEVGTSPKRVLPFALKFTSLAIAEHGRTLIAGYPEGLLICPLPRSGEIPALSAVRVANFSGSVQVVLDPTDAQERWLTLGDGSGNVERVSLKELTDRGIAAPLDDVPELAFKPWSRFARSRIEAAGLGEPLSSLNRKLKTIRSRIESGDVVQPLIELKELEASDHLGPDDHAEILAAIASIEARDGSASDLALRSIRAARDAFARVDRVDRVADMEFWEGLARSRAFDPDDSSRASQSSEAAVACLLRSLSLYRHASPPLERQALIASAAAAWALLDRGEVARAQSLMNSVESAARTDPVLARVRELDQVAAEIAMAQGDFEHAALSYTKLVPAASPGLDRLARLMASQAFGALGRWPEAARRLNHDRPDDPTWTLRRVVSRASAGLPVDSETSVTDDPIQAHARALLGLNAGQTDAPDLSRDLQIAIDGHARSGHRELAVEAELALAESFVRGDRPLDAAKHYETVNRELRTLLERNEVGSGRQRLLLALRGRAIRGWVNAIVAGASPSHLLNATLTPRTSTSAALGLDADEFREAEALSRKRGKLRDLGGPGANQEADSLEIESRRLETSLAGRRGSLLDESRRKDGELPDLGLASNEAMLAFWDCGPDGLAGIFARAGAQPVIRVLPVSRTDLDTWINDWRSHLGDGGRPLSSFAGDRSSVIAGLGPEPNVQHRSSPSVLSGSREAQIHDALIGPFEDQLAGVNRLFLIPTGNSCGVPIEIMGRGQRLLDRVAVTYLPDTSFLSAMRDSRRAEASRSGSLLFLSPGDESQVRFWAVACRKALWKPVALLNKSANRGRLDGLTLGSFEVVHLTAPIQEAGLGQPFVMDLADGLFTSHDLTAIPIRSRVLILHFAGRDGLTGEGIRTWARAGLLTGAEAIVVTLWNPPPDSARLFFSEFYKALNGGRSASHAVARAREAVAAIEKFRDPVHWAGYAVYEP